MTAWVMGNRVRAAVIAVAVVVAVLVGIGLLRSGASTPSASASASSGATADSGSTPGADAGGTPGGSAGGSPSSGATTSPSGGAPAATSVAPIPVPSASAPAVAPARPGERAAVAPSGTSAAGADPAVAITKIEHVAGKAIAPGEVSGPALRLSISIRNAGTDALDLGFTVVNAYVGADRTPASTLSQPGGSPLAGVLAPGQTATGTYLFVVPEAQRSQVTVVVDYRAGRPSAVFTGAF